MKQNKSKVKYKCSDCGRIFYRVFRKYMDDKHLYCKFCQECTLVEIKK